MWFSCHMKRYPLPVPAHYWRNLVCIIAIIAYKLSLSCCLAGYHGPQTLPCAYTAAKAIVCPSPVEQMMGHDGLIDGLIDGAYFFQYQLRT